MLGAQFGVVAIAGVHQHHAARQAGLARPTDLLERDLGLGLEADILGHARLAPAFAIRRPLFRQIQPIGHRQAGVVIGNRQRHRDLTIVLLAELAAILPCHPYRMPALLGKARVVDDPGLDRPMPLDLRQHHLAHLGQDLLVRPAPFADKMQQRLMLRRRPLRCRHRRHRLYALALARHHQANAVIPQRPGPVRMADHAHKSLDIRRKSRFTVIRYWVIHLSPTCSNVNLPA